MREMRCAPLRCFRQLYIAGSAAREIFGYSLPPAYSLLQASAPALRRDTIIIGGRATTRGVETSVREAFNLALGSGVVRECCWSSDAAAHAYRLDKPMKMYVRIQSLGQVAAMLGE